MKASLKTTQQPSAELAAVDAATLRQRLEERREQNTVLSEQLVQAERRLVTTNRSKKEIESQDTQRRASEEQKQNKLKQQISETNKSIKKLISGKRVVFNPAKGTLSKRMDCSDLGWRDTRRPDRSQKPATVIR